MDRIKSALPRTAGDVAAFGFMFVMIHFIGFFELLVVLPVIYEHHKGYTEYWCHVFSGWFIYFQVMCSLWKTMSADLTSGSLVLPSVLKPGWKFCAVVNTTDRQGLSIALCVRNASCAEITIVSLLGTVLDMQT